MVIVDRIKKCFIISFLIGLVAYGYVLCNYTPSHDGWMLIKTNQWWELAIGRFAVMYYAPLRGLIEAPWLLGILALSYTFLAVFLTMELLDIPGGIWQTFIVSSVYILNIAYISNACVYIYCWDVYALALLTAVASVYVADCVMRVGTSMKIRILGLISSVILLSLSMGLYQAYLPAAIGLYLLLLLKLIIQGMDRTDIMKKGASFLLSILCSGGVYYLILSILQRVNGVTAFDGAYESLSNLNALSIGGILHMIPVSFKQVMKYYLKSNLYASSVMTILNVLIIAVGMISWVLVIIYVIHGVWERILTAIILLIFPIAINCISILTEGKVLHLMMWSYQLLYILMLYPLLLLLSDKVDSNWLRIVKPNILVTVMIVIISLVIVRYANDILYYQKLVGEGTTLAMSGIVAEMEHMEGFDETETPVMIMGDMGNAISGSYEFQDVFSSTMGMGNGSTITYNTGFEWFTRYVFGKNYIFDITDKQYDGVENSLEYKSMPVYPYDGYMRIIDGCLVIRFE